IAINVSSRNLSHPDFSEMVLRLLEQHQLDGRHIELEVTEGALMTDMAHTIGELRRLAAANISISIDDFGTGQSSLQYLHQLPITYLKNDKSFSIQAAVAAGAIRTIEAAVGVR